MAVPRAGGGEEERLGEGEEQGHRVVEPLAPCDPRNCVEECRDIIEAGRYGPKS